MSDRIRQSIPLAGINTAVADNIVADGALADAMNVRHKNGALQNVYAPKVIHPITTPNDYTIVHRMGALPENEYIAIKNLRFGGRDIDHVAIIKGEVVKKTTLYSPYPMAYDVGVYSFGNVLYVNYLAPIADLTQVTSSSCSELVFMLKNGAFRSVDIASIEPPKAEKIEIERKEMGGVDIAMTDDVKQTKEFLYANKQQAVKDAGFIIGGFFVALAYKMTDGSLIKTSTPIFLCSETGDFKYYRYVPVVDPSENWKVYSVKTMNGIKVTIKLPEAIIGIDELIKSVTVLVSRLRVVHQIDKIVEIHREASNGLGGVAGVEYPSALLIDKEAVKLDEPMYELCDIDFRTTREVTIDYEKIKDVIHNPVYVPSFSHHTLIGRGKMEYNNRLHLFDSRSKLFDKIFPTYVNAVDKDSGMSLPYERAYVQSTTKIDGVVQYTIEINDQTHKVNYPFSVYGWNFDGSSYLFLRLANIVAYPDARATEMKIYARDTAGVVREGSLKLEKSLRHNISYGRLSKMIGVEDLTRQNTYINIVYDLKPSTGMPKTSGRVVVSQPNQLYVSAMNNPFFVAAQNGYSIGELNSKIDAINTATEQVSETKFGAYPLYIFSDQAIHAMETGSGEVLYSSIIGISNERKLPATTTVGAANAVMFIGDKGVMALEGRYASYLSNDINESATAGLIDTPFETYYSKAKLLYNSKENEIVVYNAEFDYAYIYSLYSKVWTRRTWSGTEIGSRQIVTRSAVCSLLDEDKTKPIGDVTIITRPLKLGAMELKRVETIAARMVTGTNSTYAITLEGSNDGKAWQRLAKINGQPMIRRTPSSAIYHRLVISAKVGDHLSITHFDAEYYLRFVRRMR